MAQPFNFTFGQDFFNAYQQSRRQKEEERQFNLKFGEEQRQRSLLDAFKARAEQRDIELQNASLANSQADNARANLNQAVDIQDKYTLQDKTNFFPYQSGTQALPNESLDVSSNPYLTGKVGIPKTEGQLMTENQRTTKSLEKRRLDIAEREIALKEKGGDKNELTPYQQEMQDRYNQKKEDSRSEKQQMYNDIMGAEWDGTNKAYIITEKDGTELLFKNDKALEKYARTQVIKSKIPGKINFWTREQKQGTMSRNDFIEDFKSDKEREPNEAELQYAKSKGIWK